jgi:hypothetical protein
MLTIKLEFKCGDVHLGALSICIENSLEELPCSNIEQAPSCVEIFEDLDGGHVAVGSRDML